MIVASRSTQGKQVFVTTLDTEQVFVVHCSHDEHLFDGRGDGVMVAVWADEPVDSATSRRTGRATPKLRLVVGVGVTEWGMSVAGAAPGLREVRSGGSAGGTGEQRAPAVTRPAGCRRVSPKVRRRRLAAVGVAAVVVTLALLPQPRAVPAPAQLSTDATYVVQPGDTLWTIATRVDPTGDPRPLVARLYAETGTYTIVPGERIRIP